MAKKRKGKDEGVDPFLIPEEYIKPPGFTIIVDTREQIPWKFNRSDWCSGTESTKLHQGDYSIKGHENLISIERKRSTGEIATNIFEKRFEAEFVRLSDTVAHSFIICEFTFSDMKGFPENSGIPRHRFSWLRVTPSILMKGVTLLQIKYPKVQWVFAGTTDLAREAARGLLKTSLQVAGHLKK